MVKAKGGAKSWGTGAAKGGRGKVAVVCEEPYTGIPNMREPPLYYIPANMGGFIYILMNPPINIRWDWGGSLYIYIGNPLGTFTARKLLRSAYSTC
jgi:hypothetical protein